MIIVCLSVLLLIVLLPLPSPADFQSVRLLDRLGALLYEVRPADSGSQQSLTFEQIPAQVVSALIATEDRTFYRHHGISVRGTVRALWQNILFGNVISGGSTITQQLARSRLRPGRRTIAYKVREALAAFKIELLLSKQDILQEYLNTTYFGHQAYGLAAAAKTYFDKSPGELSLAESALLIGLLQSPSTLDPFQNPSGALSRQQRVLQAMFDTQVITEHEQEIARREPFRLSPGRIDIQAPHFVFWVLSQLDELGMSRPTVQTTLDGSLQQTVESIVRFQLGKLAEKQVTSAAVVVIDARTGEILSMVGSGDYFDTAHDGAVNVAISPRQPGSTLKPFTYALALARGETAATTVSDTEVQFFTQQQTPYVPRNYDYLYHGLVRYREALANSYNIPAVKVLEKIGVSTLLLFLRQVGLMTLHQSPDHYGLALTLGAGEVTLLDLTRAYGIFPRGGRALSVCGVRPEGASTCSPSDRGAELLDSRIAWLVSDILSDPAARLPEFGSQSALNFPFPVAAKTGTTRNARDNWVIGYTPSRIVGVWVGNADSTPMRDTSGITGAGPIFHDVMLAAVRGLPTEAFERPAGMVQRTICRLSGKLATEHCPEQMTEFFIAGTEPMQHDDLFRPVSIDRRNGLLATSQCPPEFTRQQVFAFFPAEVRQWARENGWPEPPGQFSPLCPQPPQDGSSQLNIPSPVFQYSSLQSSITITRPHDRDSFLLDPLIPNQHEHIIFTARAASDIGQVQWLVDGQPVGLADGPDFRLRWQPIVGWHTVEVQTPLQRASITIEVRQP